MKVTGKITKFLDKETGTSKKTGKEWVKQTVLVETAEQYNNIYPIEFFGDEKVENLNKYQKVGDNVDVEFNVNANEWKGKYFVSLQGWKISKASANQEPIDAPPLEPVNASDLNTEDNDDLPF